MDNADLLRRLLTTFRLEGEERLNAMSLAMLKLEQQADSGQQADLVEGIFREAHSLKGAARAVNLLKVESLCQAMESVLSALKRGRIRVSPALIDLLTETVDVLGGMLEPDLEAARDTEGLLLRLNSASSGNLPRARPTLARTRPDGVKPAAGIPIEPAKAAGAATPVQAVKPADFAASTTASTTPRNSSGTVRISVDKLETLSRQVESLLSPKLAAEQLTNEIGAAAGQLAAWKKRRARMQPLLRQVEKRKSSTGSESRELQPLLEYLDSEQVNLKLLDDALSRLGRAAERDHRQLSSLVNALNANARELHMMPCSSLLEMFPRLVRDLAHELGKDVRLTIEGGEIEVDRRLLEEVRDPLTHLLRNAVDHGVEKPADRRARKKPEQGTIAIEIEQRDSNKIEVMVSDDGEGIDSTRLRNALTELRILTPDEAATLDDKKLLDFSFHSGVSTSPLITDLSGRGLGLTIVREKVELLGGSVEVTSEPGKGTTFRLMLPLTFATFHGLLVRAGGRQYVLPATSVVRVLRVPVADIRTVENRETIIDEGQALALVRLDEVLATGPSGELRQPGEQLQIVILGSIVRLAFQVDEVMGEQEVLIKPLGPQLARVSNVAGATVLGTGEVVPVLNAGDLLQSAVRPGAGSVSPSPAAEDVTAVRSILVVEDSITSRSLLKGILESSGYEVTTAVDGIDGFTTLKTRSFDLVVSDIDMPRMNGLELTAKVRADKRLAELPVILVTSLSSAEDRERGVEVGANAYIAKSGFDQSSLLEAVRRLIG